MSVVMFRIIIILGSLLNTLKCHISYNVVKKTIMKRCVFQIFESYINIEISYSTKNCQKCVFSYSTPT